MADSAGWAVRIACGAATFNARLALAHEGLPADVTLLPRDSGPDVIARLTPGNRRHATYLEDALGAAIPRRYSNRKPFLPNPVPSEVRVQLIETVNRAAPPLDAT